MDLSRGLLYRSWLRHVRYMSIDKRISNMVPIGRHSCRLLVVGGGTAGCMLAAQCWPLVGFNRCVVVEPSERHCYQPLLTLVGAGRQPLAQAIRKTRTILPHQTPWLQDEVVAFEPQHNCVHTRCGHSIDYDVMVVALGLSLKYNQIPGLVEALEEPYSGVCSNYSPAYVQLTCKTLQNVREGNCIFTCPHAPIKGPSAPMEAAFLADSFVRKNNKQSEASIIYVSSEEPANVLYGLMEQREIDVYSGLDLVAVRAHDKQALFKTTGSTVTEVMQYNMLHVTPPQGCPAALADNSLLANVNGMLEVDQQTLQHTRYPNVFGVGDCVGLSSAKTAVAVAEQVQVVMQNIRSFLSGYPLTARYDGCTATAVLTGDGHGVLLDLGPDGRLLDMLAMRWPGYGYNLAESVAPELYWNVMLRGYWKGSNVLRKILHLGFKR